MNQAGLALTEVSFDIQDGALIDWNAVYPGAGGENDNIHNACMRRLIVDFDLATPHLPPDVRDG
jgi:hypothetical protein